jgi:hypothetical protein
MWLAAFALLFAGLTNAHSHVHYCFDGQEAPAAVHLADGTDHDHVIPGHADDAEHEDLDLDVPNQALAKACKHDLPACDVHAWTISLKSRIADSLAERPDVRSSPHLRYALPQLRAPPR